MKQKTTKGLGIAVRIAMLMIVATLFSTFAIAASTGTLIFFRILIDNAPTIEFVSPTPYNGTYNTTQTINVTANDTNLANITIYVNGSILAVCNSSPCTYSLTHDGIYTFYSVANDTTGHGNITENRTIIIDKTPPLIDYSGPTPNNGIYNTTQTINITASDRNLSTIVIYVNGSIVQTCNNSPCVYVLPGDGNYTFYSVANDTAGNSNSTTPRSVIIDTVPPQIQFVAPTPQNGTYNTSQTINVTETDIHLDTITINVNGTIVKTCYSSPCTYNLTNDGNYTFYSVANDTAGNTNRTETRNIIIDQTPPLIIYTELSPYAIINGSNVSLYIDASGFDSLWAEITRPDLSKENITLTDEASTIYMNTSLLGIYNVTFFANDTAGNIVSKKDYFEAFWGILLDLNVSNSSLTGINSTFISYYRNGTVAINQSAIGRYILYVPNTSLDLQFYAYDNRITVTTYGIDIMNVTGKYIGIDVRYGLDGYLITYGVQPQWLVNSAKVRIKYDNVNYSNEDALHLFKCDNYNFTAMNCTGTWNDVTASATQNKTQKFFEIPVSSFSGFSIKEISTTPPNPPCTGCGGGGGGGEEKKICTENWECGQWNACTNNRQSMDCVDLNNCNTTLYKPITERTCFNPCYTKWNCTEWNSCSADQTQTRTCSDSNECGTRRGMPLVDQQCSYDFCHDGIMDNSEEGTDCGGNCEACAKPVIEMPRIIEYASPNILCTLLPILILLLLVMIVLFRSATKSTEHRKIISKINIVLMALTMLMMVPFSGMPRGVCMTIADALPLITEILLFFAVTFAIILAEGIYIFMINKQMIKPNHIQYDNRNRKKTLILLLFSTLLIILFSTSFIINTYLIIHKEGAPTETVLYIPLLIIAFMVIAVILKPREPRVPLPPTNQQEDLYKNKHKTALEDTNTFHKKTTTKR